MAPPSPAFPPPLTTTTTITTHASSKPKSRQYGTRSKSPATSAKNAAAGNDDFASTVEIDDGTALHLPSWMGVRRHHFDDDDDDDGDDFPSKNDNNNNDNGKPTLEIERYQRHLAHAAISLIDEWIDDCVAWVLRYCRRDPRCGQWDDDDDVDDDDDCELEASGRGDVSDREEDTDTRAVGEGVRVTAEKGEAANASSWKGGMTVPPRRHRDLVVLGREIRNFFQMFRHAPPPPSLSGDDRDNGKDNDNNNNNNNGNIRNNHEHNSSSNSNNNNNYYDTNNTANYTILQKKYNPLLLPMAIVKCHPNVLDRREMVRVLMADLKNTNYEHSNYPQQHRRQHQYRRRHRHQQQQQVGENKGMNEEKRKNHSYDDDNDDENESNKNDQETTILQHEHKEEDDGDDERNAKKRKAGQITATIQLRKTEMGNEGVEDDDNGAQSRTPPSAPLPTPSSMPCVCVIRHSAQLVGKGLLVAEVLFQCLSNDPKGPLFHTRLQKRRKKHKSRHFEDVIANPHRSDGILFKSIGWASMCEDHLVEWAKWTEEEFDSIVVVLEDPENIPSPTLDAFFASLSHLRSRHHLPIDVILMDAMPGGMGDRLSRLRQPSFHNAGGGEGGGAVIQEVFLPEPGVQFDMFVDKLFSNENRIPTFLWNNTDLFRHLHEIYRECDNSVISLARELKSVLNRYFAKPGEKTTD
mmetsp:Transcript_27945/g.58713  ORF Transcript_27945/g.58713 Transcript_27945/m.58713 type:complete len:692 (-) Transcript_27945:1091-3166(-)